MTIEHAHHAIAPAARPRGSAADAIASTLVLGVGNTLLGDDGAGVAVAERIRERALDSVRCLDGGTLNFTLLQYLEPDLHFIAVDAAMLDEPPGTVKVFEDADMDAFLGSGRSASVHEVSLAELLDMARLTGNLPRRRTLIAIQPANVDWNPELSTEVAAGVERAARLVLHMTEEKP